MNSPKQAIAEILLELPDDATFDDIEYRIYVRRKVERGLHDLEAGRTVTQEEAERRMAKWGLSGFPSARERRTSSSLCE